MPSKSTTSPPVGWREKALGEVADVSFSNVDKKSRPRETKVRLCNYLDVYQNDYVDDGLPFMEATASSAEIKKFGLHAGDVIITKDSETPDDIGIPAVVREVGPDVVCGYHLAMIRPRPGTDSVFIAKQIATDRIHRYFSKEANGTTRYGLSTASVVGTPLWNPPLPEQRVIAAILDTLDSAIRQTEQVIAKLKLMKQGLLHDLLTRGIDENGELRPPPEEAPELYTESPLGMVPRGWEVGRLGQITDLRVGFAFKSEWFLEQDGIKLLRGDNVGYGVPDWGITKFLDVSRAEEFSEYQLGEGDIVVGMDRTFTKSGVKISVLGSDDVPSLLVQRVGNFLPVACTKGFLRHLLLWSVYHRSLLAQQKGMDIPHLSKSEILYPLVPNPPIGEQARIESILDSQEQRQMNESVEVQKFRIFKTGLMNDLLTGRVRVHRLNDKGDR